MKLRDHVIKNNIEITPTLELCIVKAVKILYKQRFDEDLEFGNLDLGKKLDGVDFSDYDFLKAHVLSDATFVEVLTLAKKLEKLKVFS